MNENKQGLTLAALVAVAGIMAVAMWVAALKTPTVNVSSPNVTVSPPAITINPSSVNVEKSDVNVTLPNGSPVSSQPSLLGAIASEITYWISGDFSDDLNVQDALTVVGTSTFSGDLVGVQQVKAITMASSATTTACTWKNTYGTSKIVTNIGVVDTGTAASLGEIVWTAGTTTFPGVTPASLTMDGILTRTAGVEIISTTSTAQALSVQVRSGDYLAWISNTTTNAGTCFASFY